MKFFHLVRSGIDVAPLLAEVCANEQAWLTDTSRQRKIKEQRDTNTIFIRGAIPRSDLHINDNQESQFTKISASFPKAKAFMTAIAAEMNARLSRATIVRLKPRSRVFPHTDSGSYYLIRDRYHLVLRSTNGSQLISSGEEVRMREGELWRFNNKEYHEAHNESDEWRVHYIFDLLPVAYEPLAVNPQPPREVAVKAGAPATTALAGRSKRDFVLSAIRNFAILRRENQRLVSPNGADNAWLIDLRRILVQARVLDAVSDLFWETYSDRTPFQVAGMEAAAVPFLAAILMKSRLRGTPVEGFVVRKERKTYGTGSLIDGQINELPIVVVDDLINSGNTLEKLRVVLEEAGRLISSAFVLIDYHSPKGEAWRNKHHLPVHSVFTLAELGLALAPPKTPPTLRASFHNLWNFAAPDPNFFYCVPKSFPATDGKHVYFGSDSGVFWCLNADGGSVAWTFAVQDRGHKNIWSAPVIHDGKVYFGSYDGNVYCLDAKNGAEVWRFTGADWVGSSPALAPDLGLLFIGLEFAAPGKRGSIVALDLENGWKVWEHFTTDYTHASPAYSRERHVVACGSNDNEMFLLCARTGAALWRFQTAVEQGRKGSILHAPAFDIKRGRLVVGCANGYAYVLDLDSGTEDWSVRTNNSIYTVPLVVDDSAYFGSTDKYFYVLDLERRLVKRRIYMGSKIYGPARLLMERIYFGTCSGAICEITPSTAEVTGTHQLPDAVTNALCHNPANGHLYALTYVNHLFAFVREDISSSPEHPWQPAPLVLAD